MNSKPTNKFILLLHGHNSCYVSQLKYLELFLSLGYNAFIPNHRYSGSSGGDSITFGYREKHDIIKWLDELEAEYKNASFAAFGESMGAATAIMVTALDKRIKFLIEYCGYADFDELIYAYANKRLALKLLYPFLKPFVHLVSKLVFKVELKETNAAKAMKDIKVPTLILHSKADELVTFSNAKKMVKANPNAELVAFENSIHARSLCTYRERFTNAVESFVNKYEKSNLED